MPNWLPAAFIGLAFGFAVSGINHLIMELGIKRGKTLDPKKATRIVITRYGIRYILNIAALFIVHDNVPMLIATAIGLTGSRNIMLFRQWIKNSSKKGGN